MRLLPSLLVATVFSVPALANPASPPPAAPKQKAPPSDQDCQALPSLLPQLAFASGETLDFDLDAMGAQAGKMTMAVLPQKDGQLPVEVSAQTNTFFAKFRRVKGSGTSYLNPKSLHPTRYHEDATENEVHKVAEVTFRPKDHSLRLDFEVGAQKGTSEFRYAHDGLDVAGAVYLFRQLPFKKDMKICFDVYGIRRMWRMSGKVEGREHVSLPLGEFDAWHLSGTAVRLDDHSMQREVHVWISDDDRRLPLTAMGAIDLGVVRATLTGFHRPGEKKVQAVGKQDMKW